MTTKELYAENSYIKECEAHFGRFCSVFYLLKL